jgi:1-aminocyclopropane-1-carboxylate deaminase/D-cysteine desulfhydrase-like pyridoxal-dependent ACC family enzyme
MSFHNKWTHPLSCRLLLGEVHAPIERVLDPELDAFGVELFLKREDMIDPEISGNKWRKVLLCLFLKLG